MEKKSLWCLTTSCKFSQITTRKGIEMEMSPAEIVSIDIKIDWGYVIGEMKR